MKRLILAVLVMCALSAAPALAQYYQPPMQESWTHTHCSIHYHGPGMPPMMSCPQGGYGGFPQQPYYGGYGQPYPQWGPQYGGYMPQTGCHDNRTGEPVPREFCDRQYGGQMYGGYPQGYGMYPRRRPHVEFTLRVTN